VKNVVTSKLKREPVVRIKDPTRPIRILRRDELPLLRDHLLRLDPQSRRDRFHGMVNDAFIDNYIARCFGPKTITIAYVENDEVHGVAELHEPVSADDLPELAFSVEANFRRRGVGSILFKTLLDEARRAGYRRLRVTTGSHNDAMRALAHKFGAHLVFDHGELAGTIDLTTPSITAPPATKRPRNLAEAVLQFNRAYWNGVIRMGDAMWAARDQQRARRDGRQVA
jgi:GNAT superfamily N-acetyltransferase